MIEWVDKLKVMEVPVTNLTCSFPFFLPSFPSSYNSIAFLNFGLVSTGVLQFATGIVLAVDGCLMLFATFRYPSLFAGNTPAQPSASSSHPAAAASKGPGQV